MDGEQWVNDQCLPGDSYLSCVGLYTLETSYFLEFRLFVSREGGDLAKISTCHLFQDWQCAEMDGILLYLLKGYNIVCSFH